MMKLSTLLFLGLMSCVEPRKCVQWETRHVHEMFCAQGSPSGKYCQRYVELDGDQDFCVKYEELKR